MKKQIKLVIAVIIISGFLIPSIGTAEIDEDVITAGDTFIYDVVKCDAPWEALFEENPLFSMQDFVLDLSGSTLGVKVMGLDARDGFYALNTYIILGKAMQIPIPEDYPTRSFEETVEEIFGDMIVIPEGVGIAMGSLITGSDFLEFIDSDYDDFPGIPFYLDPNEWIEYEDMFEDFGDMLEDEIGIELTVENEGDEFRVTVEGEDLGPDADIEIFVEVAWHRTGDYAGIFKDISVQASTKFFVPQPEEYDTTEPWWETSEYTTGWYGAPAGTGSTDDRITLEITFNRKKHNPLPDEILDEETIALEMDIATFSYEATDFFDNNDDFHDWFEEIEDLVDDAEGEDIFEFEVKDVEGCYYKTDISVYDGNNLEEMEDPIWWNGFMGSPSHIDEWGEGSWEDWQIYPYSVYGIIPYIAPGITPDWNMWQASTLSISSPLEILEKAITSSDAEDALGDLGITFDDFDLAFEIRENRAFKFFYFTGEVDFVFDSTEYQDWSSEDLEEPYAEIKVTVEMWLAYTRQGLIAGMAVDLSLEANFEEFPFSSDYNYESYEYETMYDDGSIRLELNTKLKNKDFESLPDPATLPEYIQETTSESSSTGEFSFESSSSGGPIPGISSSLTLIPVLMVLAAISVLFKRRRH